MGIYQYIYYQIYCLLEKGNFSWWSDVKGWLIIAVVQLWVLALIDYKMYKIFGYFDTLELGKWGYALVFGGTPILFNYFFFQYNDRWKRIVQHFNKADKKEKRRMNMLMTVVLLFFVGFIAFMFSL